MKHVRMGWTPEHWASLRPFGIGLQRPNNYREIIRALWENRGRLPYAWRILTRGVCDGCALGTSGMRDWTLPGVHLCNIRLRLLRLNTMPAFDPRVLHAVAPLQDMPGEQVRALGRIPLPLLRQRGDRGFHTISWDTALDLIAARIRATTPDRLGFYLTSRGMPNESYYAAQKAARAIGTNSIDNAARVCHAPSTAALKRALGVAAATCSFEDWIGTDLVVFIGSNVANNQPVAVKYLHYARKAGTRIVMVNPYREPGMERYWIPSVPESALFGTRLADEFFQVSTGGDAAFLSGALKHLLAAGLADRAFLEEHTTGFAEVERWLETRTWEELEQLSGVDRGQMQAFGERVGRARSAVFVWSMGVTQHATGEQNVQAIINLALARGLIGRPGCGLMPIRGHSGVQGGAELGAYANVLPGGVPITPAGCDALSRQWGFVVPGSPGLTAPEMIDAAMQQRLDVLVACGGNFLDVMPDPAYVAQALARVPLRVHMDIVLSSQMLIEPDDLVLILPAATRYEVPGGVTETSSERRIIFSPEIPGPRPPAARPEWQVLLDLAARVRPELADQLRYRTTAELRAEIARIVPLYDGIQHLRQAGDEHQYGGPRLCEDGQFPTPDRRAHLAPPATLGDALPRGSFRLATRRGKQFNSIVHERVDPLTGMVRDAVLINARDAADLDLRDGQPVTVCSAYGRLQGWLCYAPIARRNLQVHWPEGNVLLDRTRRSPISGVPDYNTIVTVEPVAAPQARVPGE